MIAEGVLMAAIYYLTVEQAARALQLSEYRIRALCRQNRLQGARRFGGRWRILASEIGITESAVPASREALERLKETQTA